MIVGKSRLPQEKQTEVSLMAFAFLSCLQPALPLPTGFIALNSTQGVAILSDAATLRASYDQSVIHFVAQADQGSCFRASASMVLNALAMHGVPAPIDEKYSPFPYWTQDNLVASPCASSNCTQGGDYLCRGTSMDEAARVLSCAVGVSVATLHARAASFRNASDLADLLHRTLGEPGAHVVANFVGKPMSMAHYGHFSPVVAYHPGRDLALVLDVSRYKFPPWWVPVSKLWLGIDTVDSGGLKRRGVLVVKARKRSAPSEMPWRHA